MSLNSTFNHHGKIVSRHFLLLAADKALHRLPGMYLLDIEPFGAPGSLPLIGPKED